MGRRTAITFIHFIAPPHQAFTFALDKVFARIVWIGIDNIIGLTAKRIDPMHCFALIFRQKRKGVEKIRRTLLRHRQYLFFFGKYYIAHNRAPALQNAPERA